MSYKIFFKCILILFVLSASLGACSKSDDQRKFEQEARSDPNGYTETDSQGEVLSEDPDDWRISPMYRGLITIGEGISDSQPPYPNPLPLNQDLTLNLYINDIETLSRFEIYTFRPPSGLSGPIYREDDISSPTLLSPNLSGEFIANSSSGSQASGLYRILIYDGRRNIISYGDIRIK